MNLKGGGGGGGGGDPMVTLNAIQLKTLRKENKELLLQQQTIGRDNESKALRIRQLEHEAVELERAKAERIIGKSCRWSLLPHLFD